MKYRWLKEEETCEELAERLGCKINSIVRGGLIVGYTEDIDPEGKTVRVPVTRQGVEIDFDGSPASAQLTKLDAELLAANGFKRVEM